MPPLDFFGSYLSPVAGPSTRGIINSDDLLRDLLDSLGEDSTAIIGAAQDLANSGQPNEAARLIEMMQEGGSRPPSVLDAPVVPNKVGDPVVNTPQPSRPPSVLEEPVTPPVRPEPGVLSDITTGLGNAASSIGDFYSRPPRS